MYVYPCNYRLLLSLKSGTSAVCTARHLHISSNLFHASGSVDKPDSLEGSSRALLTANTTSSTGDVPITRWQSIRKRVVHECKHYYAGFKLLCIETKISGGLIRRRLRGHSLIRRERKQLIRTAGDLCRLVPFSVFVIVPFLEFTLPIFLKLFPNMLPSTFKQTEQLEGKSRARLPVQLDAAKTLQESTHHPMKSAPMVPTRSQLVALCRMLNMPSLGPTYYLRAKLRLKCQQLRADDRYLAGEGIDALTVQELHAACFERGMSLVDVTTECLQAQLQQWIDLHHVKRTPSIDLLVSNACALHERHRSVKQQQVEERNALQQLPACYLPSDLQCGREQAQSMGIPRKHLFYLEQSLRTSSKRRHAN